MFDIRKNNSIIITFILSVIIVISILSKFSFLLPIQIVVFLITLITTVCLLNYNRIKVNSFIVVSILILFFCWVSYINADFKINVRNYLIVLSSSFLAGFISSFLSVDFKKKFFIVPIFIALWLSMVLFTSFITNIHGFFYGEKFYDSMPLNINVVAGFLALIYPLIFIFIKEKAKNKIFIAIMLFILFAIFITGCKLALILSIISTMIFLFEYRSKICIKILIYLSAIILIAYIFYMFFLKVDFNGVSDRIIWWKTAYLIFKENIFFGCGLGNYSVLFKTFRPEFIESTMFAHNIMMQLLAETGIFGLLSFIILFFSFYAQFIKKITEEKDIFFYICIAMSVTTFLVINLFDYSFFVPVNMLMFFIIFLSVFSNENIKLKKNRINLYALIPICFIIIIFFIRPIIADTYYKNGIDLYVAGHYKVAIDEFKKAIKFDKKNPEYYLQTSRAYFALYDKIRNETAQLYADKAIEYNKKAIDLYKYNAQLKSSLAFIYWNNDKKEDALKTIQEAIKYDKYNFDYEDYYYKIKNS